MYAKLFFRLMEIIMMISTIEKPFSYIVPLNRFPSKPLFMI
jgi:hypothetical protein